MTGITVTRKQIIFQPDLKRIIARFFYTNDERSLKIIKRVLALSPSEKSMILGQVLRGYAKRHRSIVSIFEKHFNRLEHCFKMLDIDRHKLSTKEKLLIGSYFTMEYSIEAAAFFNPSIVEDYDQSQLKAGEKRVIISFRATGEGHVSSIVFRSAVIDADGNIQIAPVGDMLDKPSQVKNHIYQKRPFIKKLSEMQNLHGKVYDILYNKLTDTFTYEELKRYVEEVKRQEELEQESLLFLQEVMWLASSHYEMTFSFDTAISERVIFPIADTEKRGIEDARFVKFNDDKDSGYYATYTAYDGFAILPKILMTKDFYNFKVYPIHGAIAQNKGAALFPRKIKGKFAMLCRIDGENNYIAFSDSMNIWKEEAIQIQAPKYSWEFVQLGNCGSPIETEAGWLIITHGVGPMREYALGAILLDLENPTKEVGRLKFPLLCPEEREREGYVPNVVYSCGSIIHNGSLIIPYAMSDYASTYASVNLGELLEALTSDGDAVLK